MAMGKSGDEQDQRFVTHENLRASGGHPFCEALNKMLRANGFDRFVEDLCARFYDDEIGRPCTPPPMRRS